MWLEHAENAYTTSVRCRWTEYTRAGLQTVYTRSLTVVDGIKI